MQEGFGGVHDRIDDLDHQFDRLQISLNNRFSSLEERRKDLLTWLGAVSTDEDYERALSARLDGTCDWVLQRTEFRDWFAHDDQSDKTKILWIHGSAGFGKTVTCARIVEYLIDNAAIPVTHFFCVGGDEAKRKPQGIVRSWVAQLVNHSEDAVELTRNFCLGKEVRTATEADIWRIFEALSLNLGPFFYVIDGYDECIKFDLTSKHSVDSQAKFLQHLTAKISGTGSRLLLTSRDDPDIRSQLYNGSGGSSKNSLLEYKITSQDTTEDISSFSHDLVDRDLPNKPTSLKEEIALGAAQKCDGMFLWIKLMHARLSPGKNAKQLREIVRVTPLGLDQAYERDMKTIMELGTDERMRAISILRWTLFAVRPLTVRELTEALVVRDNNDTCDCFPVDDLPDTLDEYYTNDQIRRLCGSLIEIRSSEPHQPLSTHTVQFVHFSVKEYLTRADDIDLSAERMLNFSDAPSEHSLLARICLRYLCYKDFTVKHHSTEESLQSKIDAHAFFRYAAQSWYVHSKRSGKYRQDLDGLVNTLFDPEASRWLLWPEVLETEKRSLRWSHALLNKLNSHPGPMYYAAWLGLTRTMEFLRVQGLDLNSEGGVYGSALQAAAFKHDKATVEYLLQHGADVNIGGGRCGSAISAATWRCSPDQEPVIQLLIDEGANVDQKDSWGRTALFYAASYGSLESIRLLHENNANHHEASIFGRTPLQTAIVFSQEEAAMLLLNLGADPTSRDNEGWNALHHAVSVGFGSLVGQLLDRRRNVNKVPETGLPISHKMDLESDEVVDINARTNHGMTALHVAVLGGHHHVVKLLLKYNADLEIARYDGSTPLYTATQYRDEAMVKLLLNAGAKANVLAKGGWTPLHQAASSGLGNETLQLLLDSGAEVNALDEAGWTPLHFAIFQKRKYTSIQLLDAGADPNLSGDFNQTALHVTVYRNWTRMIDPLLSYGADPLLIDGFGRSCMDWASSAPSKRAIFAKMLRHCSSYRPTDSATTHETLYHSIGSTMRKLKSNILQSISRPGATYLGDFHLLNRLVRCLLFIGDTEAAFITLKKSIYYDPEAGAMACDFCDSDITAQDDRFICCGCPDIDACMMCVEKRREDPCCGGHEFFKVSIDAGQKPLDVNVNVLSELVDGWLDPLAKKYSAVMSGEAEESLSSVSDPKQQEDKS